MTFYLTHDSNFFQQLTLTVLPHGYLVSTILDKLYQSPFSPHRHPSSRHRRPASVLPPLLSPEIHSLLSFLAILRRQVFRQKTQLIQSQRPHLGVKVTPIPCLISAFWKEDISPIPFTNTKKDLLFLGLISYCHLCPYHCYYLRTLILHQWHH